MPPQFVIVLVGLTLVVGATIRTRPTLVFPRAGATEYVSPDGERWAVSLAERLPDGTFWVMFRRGGKSDSEWSEMLGFGLRETLNQARTRKALDSVKADLDPAFTYAIEGGADTYLLTYHSVVWNESGIQRVVRTPRGYCTIGYQERLGRAGVHRLRFWTKLIKGLPERIFLEQGAVLPEAAAKPRN